MAFTRRDPDIERTGALLGAGDPFPVRMANAGGKSLFLLLGDHAGNAVPAALTDLGLNKGNLKRHIALDIGVAALGVELSRRLDATFVEQRYSRLVVDCNRAPGADDAIAPVSDGIAIPGNARVSPGERAARYAEIFDPYHAAIAQVLADRDAAGTGSILISLHSFTPKLAGRTRPWPIGVLHDAGDPAFALAMLEVLRGAGDGPIGDNQPYRMDTIDYTVPRHAYPHRPYVEIEVRQDLLSSPAGVMAMSERLAAALSQTLGG